jgi:predicted metalloenzyme YecM
MKIEEIIGNYVEFLNRIFDNLNRFEVRSNELKELDHIAYRTQDIQKYNDIKKKLMPFFDEYSEKEFGGRLIFVGRFENPLEYMQFSISGLELLAPKNNNTFDNGLEHAEFVLKESLANFYKMHENIGFNLDAYDRDQNPELIIDFKDCAAKFHEISLLDVRGI